VTYDLPVGDCQTGTLTSINESVDNTSRAIDRF